MTAPGLAQSARRLAAIAWPVFVGQVAVLAFSTVDTIMVGRHDATDLAALAIGSAAYVSIFVGLMGMVMAVGPITGQLFGARRYAECGLELHQAIWLALALSIIGIVLLRNPEPFLAFAKAPPDVALRVRGYLDGLSFALPSALVFAAYRGFNIALSRPKAVMAIQLGGLLLKLPMNTLLVFGATSAVGDLHVPALGVAGCGVATALVMAAQLVVAFLLLRHDPFYAPFHVRRRFAWPRRANLVALLRLGVPMGLSILTEVTGFTFMALFISRLGSTGVAGHQIAVNMVSLMFMLPLSIANAASTLVAQRIGAGDGSDARRLGWHSVALGGVIAAASSSMVFAFRQPLIELYTHDPSVVAAALPLLAWLALFHVGDALQTVAAFVLRAYRIASVPLVINVLAMWGVGLGGGYWLAFDVSGEVPETLIGARGFWAASAAGLWVAAIGLNGFLAWMLSERRRTHRVASIDGPAVNPAG